MNIYIKGNPLPDAPRKNLSREILTKALNVINTTDKRVRYARREPNPCDIFDQLAIRAIYLQENTVFRERKFLLSFLASSISIQEEFNEAGYNIDVGYTIPTKAEVPLWYGLAEWHDIRSLHEGITKTPMSELRSKGRKIIEEVAAPLYPFHPQCTSGDVHFLATGINPIIFSPTRRKSPKKNWQSISREDLEKILEALDEGSELDGLCSLFINKKCLPGLTRLFARTAWLTGMRSIEFMTCKVIDHKTGEEVFTYLGANYFNPCNFVSEKKILSGSIKSFDDTINEIIIGASSGRDFRLHILTAKTQNSSNEINNDIRVQRLERIHRDDLKTILITSCIRKLLLSNTYSRNIRGQCSTLLGKASMQVEPERGQAITLHTLRHAFMDEARKSLPPEEVGTLSGHTSVKTMRGYGSKYARFSRNRKQSRWFPKPEKEALALTRKVWEARKLLSKQKKLENAAIKIIPYPKFE